MKLNKKITLIYQFVSLKDSNYLFSIFNYSPMKQILVETFREYILNIIPEFTKQELSEIYILLTKKKLDKSKRKNQIILMVKDAINSFKI